MSTLTPPPLADDAARILERHAHRRSSNLATVSVLVGPLATGGSTFRRWAKSKNAHVLIADSVSFPVAEWLLGIVDRCDLPTETVQSLAQRAGRPADAFVATWKYKTYADRERFWNTLTPRPGDDVLRHLTSLADVPTDIADVVKQLMPFGEQAVPAITALVPSADWPFVLWLCTSVEQLVAVAPEAAHWAQRLPRLALAIAVPPNPWATFLTTMPDSRSKAILREGELALPVLDVQVAEQTLVAAGLDLCLAAGIAGNGANATLVEAATATARAATVVSPTATDDELARSAAERFLFEFLESLPETSGRFEMNGKLDFAFGTRPAEIDLLCRTPRIALEIDGYFHFRDAACYRRDRAKDWELQRRGYLVLRFLAADVLPHLELIRDRILLAFEQTPREISLEHHARNHANDSARHP